MQTMDEELQTVVDYCNGATTLNRVGQISGTLMVEILTEMARALAGKREWTSNELRTLEILIHDELHRVGLGHRRSPKQLARQKPLVDFVLRGRQG